MFLWLEPEHRWAREISLETAAMNHVIQFLRSEDGPTSVEYAVMLALIIIVCIGAITLVGGETANFWGNNRTQLENAWNN